MSEIKVNSIKGVGATNAAITINNSDGSCTANLSNRQGKNLIINGAMQVAQRGTSFTDIGGSAGVYTLDRFRSGFTMNAGRYTITQDSNSPDGFGKSLKVDVTTQEPSLNVASGVQISQFFEGQDLQQLQKGTSSAKSMTLSFYVKSTTIGTYIVEFQDQDNSRINNKAYTINNPNTWEKKTITVEGDTTGAFTNDNNASLLVQFFLAAGTNFTSGTLQNTWGTNTNANRAVGQTNLFASTSNDWAITGVQLEVGSVATDFEHLSFADELRRCQRYYYRITPLANGFYGVGNVDQSNNGQILIIFPTTMRVKPSSLETTGTASDYVFRVTNNVTCSSVPALNNSAPDNAFLNITATSHGLTDKSGAFLRAGGSNASFLGFSSEL